ncbi:MAG: DUF5050 domain-containing protein [Clostridia bacterium]|nr:DUF5050 domain-containing protein [Clostridia bacterium]
MKKTAAIILFIAAFSACFAFAACKKKPDKPDVTSAATSDTAESSSSGTSAESKLDFTGITFTDKTVDYDGETHTITVSGAPDFASVDYTANGPFTDAGVYEITAKISAENYNTLTLKARLTINRIHFTGITFTDKTVDYDGEYHSITVSGNLPSGARVNYSSDKEGVSNSARETGEYNVTATVTEKNHFDLVLKAILKITASDEERALAFSADGNLFFQNAVDGNKLYVYNAANGEVVKVSGDLAADVIRYGENGVLYVSKTPFFSAIKAAYYDGENVRTNSLLTRNARYIQASGNYVYFAVNGLTQDNSGIYRADFSGEDPVVTLVSAGKAKYLTLYGSALYFADGNNGYKLSRVNANGVNAERTLVVDEKINNLVSDGNALYYTVNKLLGNYIEKYDITKGIRRKLTSDAGESLTVIGGDIYYVNVDKLNARLIGNGIYKVSVTPLSDNDAAGVKVIDGGEYGVCSLTGKDNSLYYYDVEGYKLIKYNISNKTSQDILKDFVKPEDPVPLTTGSKIAEYNGSVYYLNLWDSKTLHCYNPQTKANLRITTEKVTDFSIIGDYLYMNVVSYLVNNDTYVINLKTGGEAVKINDYSARDICSDGTYIYYVEENAAGARTAIRRCLPDGSNDEIIYDKGVTCLKHANGFLYFVNGNNIHSLNLSTKADTEIKVNGKSIHTTVFDTDGTYIYYREMYGIGWSNKRLARCRIDGTDYNEMVTEKTDPVSVTYKDGCVYYYSDTTVAASSNGLYKVNADAETETEPTLVLLCNGEYYATEYCLVGDDLYFIDYKDQLNGKCRLYVLRKGASVPTLIE